jgi:hypothetical protein
MRPKKSGDSVQGANGADNSSELYAKVSIMNYL